MSRAAERYGQALFELGKESGQLAPLVTGLTAFAAAYSSARPLREALGNPHVTREARRGLIQAIARRLSLPEVGIRGLLLIADRRRMAEISAIARVVQVLADRDTGTVRATVTTAKVMPEAFYSSLSAELSKSTGSRVVLERLVDSAIIGGAITQVGDRTVDGSVRGRLAALTQKLTDTLKTAVSAS